jgi:hypothetical protein
MALSKSELREAIVELMADPNIHDQLADYLPTFDRQNPDAGGQNNASQDGGDGLPDQATRNKMSGFDLIGLGVKSAAGKRSA